jgi:hypothetical protein
MKTGVVSLALLALCAVAVPAMAQDIYNNGPTNGTSDAWLINFGHVVSDTFTVGSAGAQITGLSFAAWVFPGDIPSFVEVQITSDENGGTVYYDQKFVELTQSGCAANQYGFNVCVETLSLGTCCGSPPLDLSAGTYWLNLLNAQVETNDPLYWDENSGPSSASENSVGTIPSEAFTLLGMNGTTTTGTGTVPEPSSILLLASGALGLAGVWRRKLF